MLPKEGIAKNDENRTKVRRWLRANSASCDGGAAHVSSSVTSPIRPLGGRGDGQCATGAGTGRRHRPREEREVESASGPAIWPSLRQAQALLNAPDIATAKGMRDHAIIVPCRSAVYYAGPRWRPPMGAVRADSRRWRRSPHAARANAGVVGVVTGRIERNSGQECLLKSITILEEHP